jgi:hypothetical protein
VVVLYNIACCSREIIEEEKEIQSVFGEAALQEEIGSAEDEKSYHEEVFQTNDDFEI